MFTPRWDSRFMMQAKQISTWSKDPSTKVGAVLVASNRNIVSTGYNGLPRGVCDWDSRYTVRPEKYLWVEHAERNTIYNAVFNNQPTVDTTLYVYSTRGLFVCADCARAIIQSGISNVVVSSQIKEDEISSNWTDSVLVSKQMLNEANIAVSLWNES